ncbi:MAG: hypothetical protein ACOCUU_02125 [Nanoarchaeota archaeon]
MVLKEILTMASFSSYSGGLGDLFNTWDQMGFFDIMLPFLLLFCLVYITLKGLKIFQDNNSIAVVISIAVGLMAIQFPFVSEFFSEVFPRVGIGLGMLLVIFIFWGLFFDKGENSNWQKTTMIVIGGLIAIFVLYNSAQAFGWTLGTGGDLPRFIIDKILPAVVLISLVGIAVGAGKPKQKKQMKIGLTD